MRFEVTERIATDASEAQLISSLEVQFRKIAQRVERSGNTVIVDSIEATFGSINRNDTTTVSVRPLQGAWLILADVYYRPSVAFWIILVVTLFTWVFWLVPIAFYLLHRRTVRDGIEMVFQRLGNEFGNSRPGIQASSGTGGAYDDIERLARLHEEGVLTDEEFGAKKKQLLGL